MCQAAARGPTSQQPAVGPLASSRLHCAPWGLGWAGGSRLQGRRFNRLTCPPPLHTAGCPHLAKRPIYPGAADQQLMGCEDPQPPR